MKFGHLQTRRTKASQPADWPCVNAPQSATVRWKTRMRVHRIRIRAP
jgi:hypothetical protein